jgi:hypothetical protein
VVDLGALGLQVARRAGHGRFVQPGMELFVAQGLGQRPAHAAARVAGDFADGEFGEAEGDACLAGAQCPAVQQLLCVSCLAHADPGCGHRFSPVKKPGSVCRVRVTQNTLQVSAISLYRVHHGVKYAVTNSTAQRG